MFSGLGAWGLGFAGEMLLAAGVALALGMPVTLWCPQGPSSHADSGCQLLPTQAAPAPGLEVLAADPVWWSQEGQGREGAEQKLPLKTRSLPGRCLRRSAQG